MSSPHVTSEGGYVGTRLTLMLRFWRAPNANAHIETYWRYGRRMGVALCGKAYDGERILAAYPVGSEKAADFWSVVCTGCKQAMDRLS